MAVGRKTGGRVAGVPNKLTVSVKEAVLAALAEAGGAKYLAGVARENPQVFCGLLGKLLPSEITGGNGGPIEMQAEMSAAAERLRVKLDEIMARPQHPQASAPD